MLNFDRFIGIDWSGAKSPVHTKSIAIAETLRGNNAPKLINPASHKYWSRSEVASYILNLLKKDERILIGIDANFGYAAEVVAAQFGPQAIYQDLWREVDEASKDDLNFFSEKFWQQWPEYFWTDGKRPDHITLPRRVIENECGVAGLGWPESPFKLIGPKQVGKGGLAAMRLAHYLKQSCGDQICIWPFEQEIVNSAKIIISEIYPRQFLKRSAHGNAKVKTLDDLNAALVYFNSAKMKAPNTISDHDTDALISAAGLRWLCGEGGSVPAHISNPAALPVAKQKIEGWIFGVGA